MCHEYSQIDAYDGKSTYLSGVVYCQIKSHDIRKTGGAIVASPVIFVVYGISV